MTTTAKGDSQYGGGDGGGAGGKFQKPIFRQKQRKTPYDRPPSFAAANHGGASSGGGNGWLSKIVEPASKLITASAHRLFGTVFRKRIGPAPSPPPPAARPHHHVTVPEAKHGSVEKLNHSSSNENITLEKRPDLQLQNITECVKPCNNSENNGFLKLEQMFKEKTLTRSEIDHLTSLLHSRTLGMTSPHGESSRSGEKFAPDAFHKIEQPAKSPLRENGVQYLKSYGIASTPINSAKERTHIVEEDVASPTELAKAYMGNRSPSILGFWGEAFREETPFPNTVQFTPKPMSTSLISKVRVHENGYMTPRSRGRSAIYSMARTPYSRIPQASSQQGPVSKLNTFGGPSSSIQGRIEGSRPSSSRQVALKRGSYVLDNDIGSIGPIRRIRQKSNLLPASSLSLPVSESPLSGTGTVSKLNKQANDIHPSTSFGSIPSQSSKTAQKILQQLDKLVPSKEKTSELKLTNARNESPASLTHGLLNAQARRSLEDVSFSKFLQNDRDTRVDGSPKTSSPQNFGSSRKQEQIEENNSAKHIEQSKKSTFSGNGVEDFVLKKDSIPISKSDDSIVADSSKYTPQKKWAFQMSAHEEFMDQDTDCFSNGTPTTSLAEKRENLDSGLVGNKPVIVKPVNEERPPVLSQGQPFTNSISTEKADSATLDGTDLAKKNTGFSFTAAPPATNMTIPPAIISPGTYDVKNIQPKEANSVLPVYNFSSNDVNKGVPVELPSTSAFVTHKGITPDASSHPKLESPSSSGFVAGDTAKITDKVDVFKKPETTLLSDASTASTTTPEARDMFKNPETTAASVSSTIFSFGAPANNVSASNGAFFPNSNTVSSPSPILSFQSTSTQTLPKRSSTVVLESPAFSVSSASSNASETASALPTAQLTTMPSFTSTFSSPVSKSPSGIESTDASAETKQKLFFGNVSNVPSAGASISSNASTGSSIFGFSATATTTTPVTNPFIGSNPAGASSVSLGNSQPSIGTGATNITSSVPVQISSSTSFPTFAFGGTTTVASTSSFTSSSASPPTAKPFSFGAGFGLSSSTSSSSTANAIIVPTASIFSSNPNTTAPTTTPVFSFGGAQASSAAPNNTSTNSVFPFTPSAANTPSSTSFAPSQSLFGNLNPASTFGNATFSNDQMSTEDTMAEDTTQASAVPSSVTTFGQSPISTSPAPGFVFGSTPNPFSFGNQQSSAPTMQNPFQFGNQQISTPPPNQSPFQPSGSLDFNAGGGSFSLGTGGGDKSNRRMVKVKRSVRKK